MNQEMASNTSPDQNVDCQVKVQGAYRSLPYISLTPSNQEPWEILSISFVVFISVLVAAVAIVYVKEGTACRRELMRACRR